MELIYKFKEENIKALIYYLLELLQTIYSNIKGIGICTPATNYLDPPL